MEIVYEITVDAVDRNKVPVDALITGVDKQAFYPATIRIVGKGLARQIWCYTGDISVLCNCFFVSPRRGFLVKTPQNDYKPKNISTDEDRVMTCLKDVMKKAMKGTLICRDCDLCEERNFYPDRFCKNCHNFIVHTEWMADL